MITRDKIEAIQLLLNTKIREIEESEGVKIVFGNITYDSAKYNTKMTVTSTEMSSEVENINKSMSKRYGFPENIIGLKFDHPTLGKFLITMFKPRNTKYPIIAEKINGGNTYKFSPAQLRKYLPDSVILRQKNLENLLSN